MPRFDQFDQVYDGKPRKGIAEACKTGWIYILDRTNGKPLIGIDEQEPLRLTQAISCADGVRNYLLGFYYPDKALEQHLTVKMPQTEAIELNKASGTPDDAHLVAIEKMHQQTSTSRWPVTGLYSDDHPTMVQQLADTLQVRVYWLKIDSDITQRTFGCWLRDAWLHEAVPVLSLALMAQPPEWLAAQPYGYILLCQDTQWPEFVQWSLKAPVLGSAGQNALWQQLLPESIRLLDNIDTTTTLISEQFVFNRTVIAAICETLSYQLQWSDKTPELTDLLVLCQKQASTRMTGLGDHIQSPFGWLDLVVSKMVQSQLQ
ncbi:MAG: hypothetical protein MJK04_18475, partial [Psychrosphaera sp.]|nr:hypothetical protein [Psychrosphaera sp.]